MDLVTTDNETGIDDFNDERFGKIAEQRAEALQAAKDEDIADLAACYMNANTAGVIGDLFAWYIETADPVALYREAQTNPSSMIGLAYQLAAMKMAENVMEYK